MDGPTEDTGPVGDVVGATGPVGDVAVEAATGPVGDAATGPTGPVGDVAVEAATGPTGVEAATGPTGPTGPTGVEAATGPTGVDAATGPTGLYPYPMIPTGPTYIATIDQLISQRSVALQQEATDRAALLPLTNPVSYNFTPALQQWASAGFPAGYPIVTITLTAPSPCSDGTTRTTVFEYVSYLTGGTDVGTATAALDARFLGITIGYIVQGNTLRICANRE